MKIAEFLNANDFQEVGEIIFDPKQEDLTYRHRAEKSSNSSIYCWCELSNNEILNIIYLGKAGKGINVRMSQHIQGFKGKERNGSKSGLEKSNFIKEIIGHKSKILVFEKLVRGFESLDNENLNVINPTIYPIEFNGEVSLFSLFEDVYINYLKQMSNDFLELNK
jgi:hypothetical protein